MVKYTLAKLVLDIEHLLPLDSEIEGTIKLLVSGLTFHLLNTCPVLVNSVDPDQLASEEAN